MKRIVVLFAVLILGFAAKAQLPELSDSAEFYLLTCEPGNISYEKFGHTGIRVVDNGYDFTINWGIFSFDEPNFIGRFVLGHTDYMVDAWNTDLFLEDYRERGSAVYQNKLNLSKEDKRRLWKALQENFKPENRKYRYNFIYDNCSTRAYQMIVQSADSAQCNILGDEYGTYRQMVNHYAKTDTWLSLGINIVFGADADEPTNRQNSTTFPMEAMTVLAYTTNVVDSARVPILGDTEMLFNGNNLFSRKHTNRFMVFLMFLLPIVIVLLMTLWYMRKRHYWKLMTQIVLWVSGLLGLLIMFLMYISSHPLVGHNWNILWCNPFNIVLAIILFTKVRHRVKGYSALVMALCPLSYLLALVFEWQDATLPLIGWMLLVFGTELLVLMTYVPFMVKRVRAVRHHHHHHHHHSSNGEHHHSDGSEHHHHHHNSQNA